MLRKTIRGKLGENQFFNFSLNIIMKKKGKIEEK